MLLSALIMTHPPQVYYNNSDDNSFMEYDSQEASSSLSAFMHSCRCDLCAQPCDILGTLMFGQHAIRAV